MNFSNYKADIAAVISVVLVTTGTGMIYMPAALILLGIVFGALAYTIAKGE